MAIIRLYIAWERSWVQYATTVKITKITQKKLKLKKNKNQKTKSRNPKAKTPKNLNPKPKNQNQEHRKKKPKNKKKNQKPQKNKKQKNTLRKKKGVCSNMYKLHVSSTNSGLHQFYYRFKRKSYIWVGVLIKRSLVSIFVILMSGVVTVYSTITIS